MMNSAQRITNDKAIFLKINSQMTDQDEMPAKGSIDDLAWILLNTIEEVQQQVQHCFKHAQVRGHLTPNELVVLEKQHWELKIKLGLFVGTHPLVQQYQSTQDSLASLLYQTDEGLLERLELEDVCQGDPDNDLEATFLFHKRQKFSSGMELILDELRQVSDILSILHSVLLIRPQVLFHSEIKRFSRLSKGVIF